MARKPRDYDAEVQALMERAKKLKGQKTTRLGELVQVTGADTLPIEALAGVLLAAVEQAKKQPEAVARWTERGEALFRTGKRDGSKAGSADNAAGATPAGPSTPAAGGGA
ncbi:MAG: conjugal transfer protein TraC [Acetobacteraceae bacterium]|nr:MAG: conjugal transfer protein TraC [Acetobacteraceae bacterium]